MIALGWFIVGIAALIGWAEGFRLAARLGVPPLMIGLTIVSLVREAAPITAPRPRETTLMNHFCTILTVALTLYGLGMCLFLISENRRPQAALAWMLALIFAPGIGLLIYILFGGDWKAFSKQSRLLRQDIEAWHGSALKRGCQWKRSGSAEPLLGSRDYSEPEAEMRSVGSRF